MIEWLFGGVINNCFAECLINSPIDSFINALFDSFIDLVIALLSHLMMNSLCGSSVYLLFGKNYPHRMNRGLNHLLVRRFDSLVSSCFEP